ncbi:hypothetical protein RJ640_024761 [Escallonia rubra]|uniref:C2 domain-containing protein n=1 Tax=Escallonia rubra TaxID=112253 RepID=A0AA88RKJ6_9ASTE|nr:hypothetical protein RJ640_024761 [Escallonia rubra]
MEFRPLDITVIGAQGLKRVNMFSKMNLYTLVTVSGDQRTRRVTPVAKKAGKNPTWNHRISFSLPEYAVSQASLVFQIMCERILGDRIVGQVSVPIHELLANAPEGNSGAERVVEYMVRTISLKTKGTLEFSYKVGDKFTQAVDANVHKRANEPVMAYPPSVGPSGGAYPPPPGMGYAMPHPGMTPPGAGYGYGGHPPPPAYGGGYPPQPMGYQYMPAQHRPKKRMGGGGLGLGLGAGLLGGLLVGDMISDFGDMGAYDAGYDAGFDDAGF